MSRSTRKPILAPKEIYDNTESTELDLYNIPKETQLSVAWLHDQNKRVYIEGYLRKENYLKTDGSRCYSVDKKYYAKLKGTVLYLWEDNQIQSARLRNETATVQPTYINITDASLRITSSLQTRENNCAIICNILTLSTAGLNRYLLDFGSTNIRLLLKWRAAFTLAMFERATLQEAYTGSLLGKAISDPATRLLLNDNESMTKYGKFMGWCNTRFGRDRKWETTYIVVQNLSLKRDPIKRTLMKRDGKNNLTWLNLASAKVLFYSSKQMKKKHLVAEMTEVFAGYAIYPDRPELIQSSNMIKLEGKIRFVIDNLSEDSFVSIMPSTITKRSDYSNLLIWLVCFYDAFALYGRPARLQTEADNINSLTLAIPGKDDSPLTASDVRSLLDQAESSDQNNLRLRMKQLLLDNKGNRLLRNNTSSSLRFSRKRSTRSFRGPPSPNRRSPNRQPSSASDTYRNHAMASNSSVNFTRQPSDRFSRISRQSSTCSQYRGSVIYFNSGASVSSGNLLSSPHTSTPKTRRNSAPLLSTMIPEVRERSSLTSNNTITPDFKEFVAGLPDDTSTVYRNASASFSTNDLLNDDYRATPTLRGRSKQNAQDAGKDLPPDDTFPGSDSERPSRRSTSSDSLYSLHEAATPSASTSSASQSAVSPFFIKAKAPPQRFHDHRQVTHNDNIINGRSRSKSVTLSSDFVTPNAREEKPNSETAISRAKSEREKGEVLRRMKLRFYMQEAQQRSLSLLSQSSLSKRHTLGNWPSSSYVSSFSVVTEPESNNYNFAKERRGLFVDSESWRNNRNSVTNFY